MRTIIKITTLFILLFTVNVFAFSYVKNDSLHKENLIKEGSKQLKMLVAKNLLNDSLGKSHLNKYIFFLSQENNTNYFFEYGENKLFIDEAGGSLELMNEFLVEINSRNNDIPKIYVGVHNEVGYAIVRRKVTGTEVKNKAQKFKDNQINSSYQKVYDEYSKIYTKISALTEANAVVFGTGSFTEFVMNTSSISEEQLKTLSIAQLVNKSIKGGKAKWASYQVKGNFFDDKANFNKVLSSSLGTIFPRQFTDIGITDKVIEFSDIVHSLMLNYEDYASKPFRAQVESWFSKDLTDIQKNEIANLLHEITAEIFKDYKDVNIASYKSLLAHAKIGVKQFIKEDGTIEYDSLKKAYADYLINVKNTLKGVKKLDEQTAAVALLSPLTISQLETLPFTDRKIAFTALLDVNWDGEYHPTLWGLFGENEETLALRLLKTTPKSQYSKLLTFFEAEGAKMLHALDNEYSDVKIWFFGDGNYKRFADEITRIWAVEFEKDETPYEDLIIDLYKENKIYKLGYIRESPIKNCESYVNSVFKVGKIFSLTSHYPTGVEVIYNTSTHGTAVTPICKFENNKADYTSPFDPAAVFFSKDIKIGGQEYIGKKLYVVPAYLLHHISSQKINEAIATASEIVIDIAFFAIGVGEIRMLAKLGDVKKVLVVFDLLASTADIAAKIANINKVQICGNDTQCQNRLKNLNSVTEALTIVAGVSNLGEIVVSKIAKKLEALEGMADARSFLNENSSKLKNALGENEYERLISTIDDLAEAGSDLLMGIKNTLKTAGITDISILSKLDNWKPSTLTKFDDLIKNSNYTGLLNEFKLNTDLFDKFKLVEETWWAKYSMAGISKRAGSSTPSQFKKYVGDIEVNVTGGGKLKLKNISLNDASGQYLGKLFDDAITQNVKSSWIAGDFSQFPTVIQNHLTTLKSQGYKLVVEPQVTVLGKNPKPDFLLVKTDNIAGITTYDVKYLEIKYLDDVPYTASQKAITENVPVQVIKKDLDRMYDVNDIEVVPFNTHITVNEVAKLTVDKSTLEMILQ